VPIRIFAIDPVPGSAGAANWHMWSGIDKTHNIKSYQIVIAQNETRRTFAPVLPPKLPGGLTNRHLVLMPGNHSGIVEPMGAFKQPSMIVKDLAKRFLMSRAHKQYGKADHRPRGCTEFAERSLLTPNEVLELYSEIRNDFRRIRKTAQRDTSNFYGLQMFGARRAVRTQDKAGGRHATAPKISRRLQGYFVNTYHADLFKQYISEDVHDILRHETSRYIEEDLDDNNTRALLNKIHSIIPEDVWDYIECYMYNVTDGMCIDRIRRGKPARQTAGD
jgi:hypothetical protein